MESEGIQISSSRTARASTLFYVTALLAFLQTNTHVHGLLKAPEYDFIIVGGGAAGCVLANRLSEVPDWNVLLIEAGGEENFIQDIPLIPFVLEYTPADWKYRTERSNSSCFGSKFGLCHWPRGRVLGGTTVLNYMIYSRGIRADYDGWEALGNTGWGYDDILPYFLKSEHMTIPSLANDTKYHSTKGELVITYPIHRTKLAEAFINAGLQRGYNYVDYNAESEIGYSYLQTTIKDARRWSAYRAFLEPVRTRKNLHVATHSLVTKVLIDENTRVAYGVEYKKWGLLPVQARARKEVILSAGAINSPQLLMLSGIGPSDHLQEVQIKVIQDSKVGYNLQDHVTLGNLYFTLNQSVGLRFDNIFDDLVGVVEYFLKRDGILTIPGGTEAFGFENVGDFGNGEQTIELLFAASTLANLHLAWHSWGARTDILFESYLPLHNKDAFTIFPILIRPYSRGRILLKNKNPCTHPLIDANYFSDRRDIEIIIKGIRRASELTKTDALQKYGAELYRKTILPCKDHEFDSDAFWECNIRYMTFTIFHPVGTCKMGNDSDPDAVVDRALRVRGVKQLRVSDASIMPTVPSGHTMAPVYMIAEKTADLIKADWLK
ncbi:Glucose dehydrogenase [FAD, quinone] [Cryptotermes secundus]|uniref:Glucose dehydrogenase [FAD, quinone] n=1 Tax=Cryptotermes secundus TaxID=105785 RepID=A0A2J7QFH4_9NEOP|nr:Glucose dehydrogenase [FAD, quinone] [Cryptotermes secundus]